LKNYCNGVYDSSTNSKVQTIIDDINSVQTSIATTPSTWMCTTSCPCPPALMNGTNGKSWYSNYTSAGNYTYKG